MPIWIDRWTRKHLFPSKCLFRTVIEKVDFRSKSRPRSSRFETTDLVRSRSIFSDRLWTLFIFLYYCRKVACQNMTEIPSELFTSPLSSLTTTAGVGSLTALYYAITVMCTKTLEKCQILEFFNFFWTYTITMQGSFKLTRPAWQVNKMFNFRKKSEKMSLSFNFSVIIITKQFWEFTNIWHFSWHLGKFYETV